MEYDDTIGNIAHEITVMETGEKKGLKKTYFPVLNTTRKRENNVNAIIQQLIGLRQSK